MRRLAWDSINKVDTHDGGYHRQKHAAPYNTARWHKLSRCWRDAHPLCERCKLNGIIKQAECVDHIIPWPVCEDFYDTHNLQSLCNKCNMEKGFEDKPKIAEWKKAHPNK